MTAVERHMPSIYPYDYRCYAGDLALIVTEANRTEQEARMKLHVAEHRRAEQKAEVP